MHSQNEFINRILQIEELQMGLEAELRFAVEACEIRAIHGRNRSSIERLHIGPLQPCNIHRQVVVAGRKLGVILKPFRQPGAEVTERKGGRRVFSKVRQNQLVKSFTSKNRIQGGGIFGERTYAPKTKLARL